MTSIYPEYRITNNDVLKQEIERKFLVQQVPDLAGFKKQEIVQGYLLVSPDGDEVRLRQKGSCFFQTVKSSGGLTRTEVEVELSEKQFNILWPLTAGRRVRKTRYELPLAGNTIELDIYDEPLTGLATTEVEFGSIADSEAFEIPDWFGEEITLNDAYKNRNLALHGLPGSHSN